MDMIRAASMAGSSGSANATSAASSGEAKTADFIQLLKGAESAAQSKSSTARASQKFQNQSTQDAQNQNSQTAEAEALSENASNTSSDALQEEMDDTDAELDPGAEEVSAQLMMQLQGLLGQTGVQAEEVGGSQSEDVGLLLQTDGEQLADSLAGAAEMLEMEQSLTAYADGAEASESLTLDMQPEGKLDLSGISVKEGTDAVSIQKQETAEPEAVVSASSEQTEETGEPEEDLSALVLEESLKHYEELQELRTETETKNAENEQTLGDAVSHAAAASRGLSDAAAADSEKTGKTTREAAANFVKTAEENSLKAAADIRSEIKAKSEAAAGARAEAKTSAEAGIETKAEEEAAAEEIGTKPGAGTKAEAAAGAKARAGVKAGAATKAEVKAKAEAGADAKALLKTEAKAGSEAEAGNGSETGLWRNAEGKAIAVQGKESSTAQENPVFNVVDLRQQNYFVQRSEMPAGTVRTTPDTLIEDIGKALGDRMPQGDGTLTIELEPASLGKLAIRVMYEAGKATVTILTSNPKTLEILNEKAAELASILEEYTGQETIIYTQPPEQPPYGEQGGGGQQRNLQEEEQDRSEDRRKKEQDSFAQRLRLGLVSF